MYSYRHEGVKEGGHANVTYKLWAGYVAYIITFC